MVKSPERNFKRYFQGYRVAGPVTANSLHWLPNNTPAAENCNRLNLSIHPVAAFRGLPLFWPLHPSGGAFAKAFTRVSISRPH